MEKADGPNEVAYALRSNIGSIIITCARLVGGDDWARSISLDIRQELYGNESYQQYLGEY
jgi:O6-methylguanine-DNA--protein-cysteine methyltransferase